MAEKRIWTFALGLKRSDGTPVPDHWRPKRELPKDQWYDHFIPNLRDKKEDKIEVKERPEEYFYIKPNNFIADCKLLNSKVHSNDPILSHALNAKELVGIIERLDFEIRYLLLVKEQQLDLLKTNPMIAKYITQYEKSKKMLDRFEQFYEPEEGAPN